MSNEDELMEEETSDEEVEEEADVESEDTYTGEVEVPSGGGCSAGTWIIILLIIAALVAVGVWQAKKRIADQAAQDAAEREEVRETQLAEIGNDLVTVETRIQQGDIAGAIDALEQMDTKLEIVQTAANTSGDSDAALGMNAPRSAIQSAVKQLRTKYEEMQQAANESIAAVRDSMGAHAPPPVEATGGEEQPGEEEQPAEGEEAGAGDEGGEAAAGAEEAPAEGDTGGEAAPSTTETEPAPEEPAPAPAS